MQRLNKLLCSSALLGAVAHSAHAQRGRGAPPSRPDTSTNRPPATRVDTTRRPAAPPVTGVALDFQDQELRTVLDAIAAAGELNVALTNIPSQRITVHMGRPVNRDGMIDMLKQVSEAHGLKVTETPSMIQIVGPAPDVRPQAPTQQQLAQQMQQANPQQQIKLFTYRLKHASSVQLAPVLTNLFTGATGLGGGRGQVITTAGGVQIAIPGGGGAGGAPGGFAGGGRGGGRGNANANAAANVQTQIANALAQAAGGGLSAQAGDIRIIAEESSNSLLVRATEPDWQLIQQVIQGVDLRPLQVLIEVTIAEVQRTQDYDLGVSGNLQRGRRNGLDSITAPSAASAREFILALTGGNGSVRYDVAIAALQERGNVRVLSLPVIIAQNNRQAILNVGSRRPFVQVSQTVPNDPTGRVETVQYLDVGTVLTITPTINPDGYVNLQVQQTDNSASNEVAFDAPVLNTREATTQIFVRDGQTTVIGGLAGHLNNSTVSGIPFLSRIPLIGPLIFGRTTKSTATDELFLFLTPHVISTDDDVDKYRDAVKSSSDLLKDVNIGPRIVPGGDSSKVRVPPDSGRGRP